MGSLVWNIIDGYNYLMEQRHPRSDGWFLMSSPLPTAMLCSVYIYFVKFLGPRLMKDRPAFELKGPIIIYNTIQVVVSTYLVYGGLRYAWGGRYSYRCQPVDYSDDPDEINGFFFCWLYYFIKFVEFLDTIFFVLRKKFDQITYLHVIHHAIMPASTWIGTKFAPSGHGTFFGLMNSFVHIIMYAYYLLAALGPKYQKYLWWKKHLTFIQMIQFALIFVHTSQLFFIDCPFPKPLTLMLCFHSLMFLSLFSNFYIQAYIKRRRLPCAKKSDERPEIKKKEDSNNNETNVIPLLSTFGDFLKKVSGACFIGQNDLYQPNEEKTKSKDKKAL